MLFRSEQIVHYNSRTVGVDFGPSDYAEVARGLGLAAERLADLDALTKGVSDALSAATPTLFDVPIDPEVNAWTYPAFRPHEPEEG